MNKEEVISQMKTVINEIDALQNPSPLCTQLLKTFEAQNFDTVKGTDIEDLLIQLKEEEDIHNAVAKGTKVIIK